MGRRVVTMHCVARAITARAITARRSAHYQSGTQRAPGRRLRAAAAAAARALLRCATCLATHHLSNTRRARVSSRVTCLGACLLARGLRPVVRRTVA